MAKKNDLKIWLRNRKILKKEKKKLQTDWTLVAKATRIIALASFETVSNPFLWGVTGLPTITDFSIEDNESIFKYVSQ